MISTHSDHFRRTVLGNGLRVVSEELPEARSVSVGIFIETGSRDEPEELAGIAHFLEHMAFKGTTSRTPKRISLEIERAGGSINAFTSREITGFHATVLAEEFTTAIQVLSDIIVNSTFPVKELEKERGVVMDELRSVHETPDDYIFELWQEQVYHAHPLGRSILGNQESLMRIDRDKLVNFVEQHYHPKRMVVAAAGAVKHEHLCELIERLIPLDGSRKVPRRNPAPKAPITSALEKTHPSENAHIVFGCRAYAYGDVRKMPLLVLNTMLGAGMSSRLFQEIRERRGIAYTVYSFHDSYRDTGLFGIYLGTETRKLDTARSVALGILNKMTNNTIRPIELKQAKTQLKGSIILALESSSSRMSRLARIELFEERYLSIDEVAKRIDTVTIDDLHQTAQQLWGNDSIMCETRLVPSTDGGNS